MVDDHPFWLCLTHDVDRPYKTYQSLYYAVRDLDPYHLRTILPDVNPFWQFEEIMALEDDLGVRSAFYFLDEKNLFREMPPRAWLRPRNWKLFTGRYDIDDPDIRDVIRRLDAGGWEVGLHGSYESYDDRARLREEKKTLEEVLGHEILGGRQHYLNLKRPETWEHHRAIGLHYDASLGSRTDYGFSSGYGVVRPLDDSFVVFPLTIMELTLPGVGDGTGRALRECKRLIDEARDNRAIMTVLWHPNRFNEREYPGYRPLYRQLVEYALEQGGWVGPPGELYWKLNQTPYG